MKRHQPPDYALLDRPDVLMRLFHPRAETGYAGHESGRDLLVSVEKDTVVGTRFFEAGSTAGTILFFHGNGEIVADYHDLGPIYVQMGINFLPVDYRGYGRSSGKPSVSAMMADAHVLFDFTKKFLADEGYSGPLVVMGRSLGSASALELASTYPNDIDGLIIESGFAYAAPLLRLLGIDPFHLGFDEDKGFRNINKIRVFNKPTLIIHAEHDHIIPFNDGQALYDHSGADDKTLLKIMGANHNDIFIRGLNECMAAVGRFMSAL